MHGWGLFLVVSLVVGCTSGGDRGGPSGTRDAGPGDGGGVITGRCDRMVDSDGDGLFDDYETTDDIDGDGMGNHLDTDSDGDGIGDLEEGGMRGGCAALNTDGADFADYQDNDSDNDGLSDREERERYATDPRSSDSDGDGFDDLAEIATESDPLDPADGIPPEDFYVVLPYLDPPVIRELRFGTTIRKADVHFMMDRTGSMTEEEAQLRVGLSGLVDRITTTIPDLGVGVAGFSDFPVECSMCCVDVPIIGRMCGLPYGQPEDRPYTHIIDITTDRAEMQRGVDMLRADLGGATWASSTEALYQAATGAGIGTWVPPKTCVAVPDEEGIRYGYPCFRPGALPILVVLTDTSSRNGPMTNPEDDYRNSEFPADARPHTYLQTLDELRRIGARTFGVISGEEISSPTPEAQFREWATQTGTVDSTGAPIFFRIAPDGTGLTDRVAEAIEMLAGETPQDLTTTTRDGADFPERADPIDARNFIKAIRPARAFDSAGTEIPPEVLMRDDTTFYGVTPGTLVSFDVTFENDFVMPAATAQVFRATIIVLGNSVAELDSREVIIVVPTGSAPLI